MYEESARDRTGVDGGRYGKTNTLTSIQTIFMHGSDKNPPRRSPNGDRSRLERRRLLIREWLNRQASCFDNASKLGGTVGCLCKTTEYSVLLATHAESKYTNRPQ